MLRQDAHINTQKQKRKQRGKKKDQMIQVVAIGVP
jgi:hypothetical protein